MAQATQPDPSHTEGNTCGKSWARPGPAPGLCAGAVRGVTGHWQLVKSLSQREKGLHVGERCRVAKHHSQGGDTRPHAPTQPQTFPREPCGPLCAERPLCLHTHKAGQRRGWALINTQQNHHYSCSYRSPGTSGTHPWPCTGIKV